ncbi:TetR/AcrR family transcriptional regulator [Rubritalea spongiae]|uniref:TetR/AcrR family transcriptional regulator n=1 Tax=Rubritalea spongiae TaxID=430797 RepID=A0ABW5DZT8_9BACT
MTVKDKLVNSAIKVFSKNGYRDAKVAEIVRVAKANIAAVNYYFGSKEKLFAQVLRRSFEISQETYPIDGGLSKDAPADQRLEAYARAIVARTLDPGPAGAFSRIMAKTVQSPGTPIDTICNEITTLQIDPLKEILYDFLGPQDEHVYGVAVLNILGLGAVVANYPYVIEKIFGPKPDMDALDTFINQQVTAITAATASFKNASFTVSSNR